VGRAKRIAILELQKVEGYQDKCIAEAVQITDENLGRPVIFRERTVDLTPFHKNKGFLDREKELERVTKGLAESYWRVCITGMGGTGETQLALEYIYRHKQEYGQILWIDADGGNSESSYIGLASHLGVKLDIPSGVPVRGEADLLFKVREALEFTAVPCLLVLDNVDNQNGLAGVVPRSGPCHIIATSRLRALENFVKVEVGVLEKVDRLRILRNQKAFSEEAEEHIQTPCNTARIPYSSAGRIEQNSSGGAPQPVGSFRALGGAWPLCL
jgi:hypothetical protein